MEDDQNNVLCLKLLKIHKISIYSKKSNFQLQVQLQSSYSPKDFQLQMKT